MKKALSRVLSLALVLVMVLGVMPAALADTLTATVSTTQSSVAVGGTVTFSTDFVAPEGYTATYKWGDAEASASATSWESPAAGASDASISHPTLVITCTDADPSADPALDAHTVNVTAASAVPVVKPTPSVANVAMDLTNNKSKTLTVSDVSFSATLPASAELTISLSVKSGDAVTVDGAALTAVKVGSAVVTATLGGAYAENLSQKTADFTVNVTDGKATPSIKASTSLAVGQTETLAVSYTPAEIAGITYTKNWKSSNEAVATVADGVVTAVGEGTATISVVLSHESADEMAKLNYTAGTELKCTVTVTDTVAIVASSPNVNVEVDDTEPLSYNYTGLASGEEIVEWVATSSNEVVAKPFKYNDNWWVEGKSVGEAAITLTLKVKVKETDVVRSIKKTVYVGVYEENKIEATLKDTVGKFDFADSGIFSSLKKNNRTYTNSSYSLQYLLRGAANYIELNEHPLSEKVGTFKVGFGSTNKSSIENAKDIVVTMNGKAGSLVLHYESTTSHGSLVDTGTITIKTAGYEGDIIYKTTTDKSITFNEDDFARYWNASDKTGSLDFVKFDISSMYGTVYTDATGKTAAKRVDAFYNKATGSQLDLDAVTYAPYSRATAAYTVKIPFTCYSTTSSEITLTGVLAIEVSLGGHPFTDMAGYSWANEAVSYVYNNGLMNGVSTTKFGPSQTTTRGMIMTILARMDGVDTSRSNPWYQTGMLWAKAEGVSDGTNPTGVVTREQIAAMLYRNEGSPRVYGNLSGYPDAAKVSSWAKDAMIWATEEGIITGKTGGKLDPAGLATRAEVATMLMRYCQS